MITTMLVRNILLLNHIYISLSIIVQPKGPLHRYYAVKCIEQITMQAYNFTNPKSTRHSQLLLTYMITRRLTTPEYEIQKDVLRILHNQALWSIEVIQYGRQDFKSYSENCKNYVYKSSDGPRVIQPPSCIRKHVLHLRSHLCIIIVDYIEKFYEKLDHLVRASSFNNKALYIIYYTKIVNNNNNYNITHEIIAALYGHSIRKMIVMVPLDASNFGLYKLHIEKKMGTRCYSNYTVNMLYQCNQGTLLTNGVNIYQENEMFNHYKCFIYVHALPYEPYVISRTSGIETNVIREIGKALNISFRIRIYPNATRHLGYKYANGSWSGFLRPIFNDYHLAVGNIQNEAELIHDFTYSVGYHWAKITFIVPIAEFVPRWRVLMVIFKLEIWGVCLVTIFGFAIAFYIFKTKKEVKTYKTFEKCLVVAYQILIAHPVPMKPICYFTRVYFITLAFFGIIINSVYTSSLIYYLQNPISEHQISQAREVAQSDLAVGASPKHMKMFNTSQSKYAKFLLNRYQTVNESLDTYNYWLKKVANDRNISTIATQLCVNYLLAKGNPIVVNKYGKPKIFILPIPLRIQPIGILMKKGDFLEDLINRVIQKLIIEAGIINKLKSNYSRLTTETSKEENSKDDEEHHSLVSSLSVRHLEGAFAILALGEACGLLILIIEIICFYIKNVYKKKAK